MVCECGGDCDWWIETVDLVVGEGGGDCCYSGQLLPDG